MAGEGKKETFIFASDRQIVVYITVLIRTIDMKKMLLTAAFMLAALTVTNAQSVDKVVKKVNKVEQKAASCCKDKAGKAGKEAKACCKDMAGKAGKAASCCKDKAAKAGKEAKACCKAGKAATKSCCKAGKTAKKK